MIVLLSSLFLSGSVLQVLEDVRKSLFFFPGKDGEDRTRDLTAHNLTSCRRRHLWRSGPKCYARNATRAQEMLLERKKCYSSFCLLNSFCHRTLWCENDFRRHQNVTQETLLEFLPCTRFKCYVHKFLPSKLVFPPCVVAKRV